MSEPAEAPRRHLPSHVFNVGTFVIGGIALAWMMRSLGWRHARDILERVGGWFGVIVLLDLAGLCLDAAAVRAFMKPEARMVSYLRVLAAQASGRAINILTPGGALGEATKVSMLVTHAPRDRVISSIVLANLASFYLSVAIVLVGVPITLALVDLPRQIEIVVGVALAILVPLVVGLGVVIHRGALGTVLDSAKGLRILSGPRATALKARLLEVDRHLRELQTDRSPGTREGMAFILLSRLCSWTALVTLLHALGVTITATLLVGVLSVGVLIGWASAAVPLGLGVADGSNYVLYDVLGATGAHGVFVTLLNRARAITTALIGISVMGVAHTATRVTLARRRRHFDELRRRAR